MDQPCQTLPLALVHLWLPWIPSDQSYQEVQAPQAHLLGQDCPGDPSHQPVLWTPWDQSFLEFLEDQGILGDTEDLENIVK